VTEPLIQDERRRTRASLLGMGFRARHGSARVGFETRLDWSLDREIGIFPTRTRVRVGHETSMDDEQIACFNRAQSQRFDELHRRFLERLPADVIERMERIVAAPEIRPGETVLDVGTGTGALVPLIRRYRPGRVIACDLSANMLEQVARLHPDVERHRVDIRDLELPRTSIDVVFMNGMFGNIADKQGALGNVGRMLRSGGRVVISHPEGRRFVASIARADPFPITPLPSPEQAEALLRTAGLAVRDYIDEEKLLICLAIKA
jgi:demethylmenaquinone methyltransferase/2-methoxy-6-polyprenyl-1,4-benzoquinol methylase